MRNSYCLILLLWFLVSCAGKKDPLVKVWQYNDSQDSKEQLEDYSKYGGTMEYRLTAANFMDLQPDSTYTSYFSFFDYGKWFFKNGSLILVSHNRQIIKLQVSKLCSTELICINKMKRKVYRFNGLPNNFAAVAEDPFSVANNHWRIKAKHKESEAELRARLKNHFSFWEKYFAWGLKNKIDYLDVRSTPSILKMYGNGFELEYYDNLFPEWKNNFYDTADCRVAYDNLYYKMYEKNVNWPDTKNRFERFVAAFNQLQGWMDEKMSPYVKRETEVKIQK
ncbi:MAG: hypothetical protein ACTHOF_11920 [Flavisolibacter sp.]